jgi:hypothetical protein
VYLRTRISADQSDVKGHTGCLRDISPPKHFRILSKREGGEKDGDEKEEREGEEKERESWEEDAGYPGYTPYTSIRPKVRKGVCWNSNKKE